VGKKFMVNRSCVGKTVITKFFANLNSENSSKLITRTLGKVGFIVKGYKGALPKNEEFWKVKIVNEVLPGERKGCFLIEPVEKVTEGSISRLTQGLYSEEVNNGILFVTPKENGINWILPLAHKKSINDVYAILVELDTQ
jgi:hypothetical protein